MRRILVLLAGCGRLDFASLGADAPAQPVDTVSGHDEDGDGVADVLDDCPCTSDAAQDDADGDRIGDACDPHPATAGDALALFASFESGAAPMTVVLGTPDIHGDAWYIDDAAAYGEAHAGLAIHSGAVTVTADVATAPGAMRQLAIGLFDDQAAAHNYAEIYNDAGSAYLAVSQYDGTNYFAVSKTPIAQGVHTGTLTLTVTVAPGAWTASGGWPGELYSASGSASYFASATTLSVGVLGWTGAVRSVCAITSP